MNELVFLDFWLGLSRHLRPKQPEAERKDPETYLLTAATVGVLAKADRQ